MTATTLDLALLFYEGVPWEKLTAEEREAFHEHMERFRSTAENVDSPTGSDP